MDTIELDLMRQKAGAEYLSAMETLGLQVDALFWTYDQLDKMFVLVLATEMFDFKGPLAVSELLFKAYNAAATPKEIDPFVVRLHSPRHSIIKQLDGWRYAGSDGITRYGLSPEQADRSPPILAMNVNFGELDFRTAWVYRFKLPKKRDYVALNRRWKRFATKIDQIAA